MDIDVVVPGGALGVLYTLAGVALIRELEEAGHVRVRAYYATSAGSILAVGAICFPNDEMVRRTLELVFIAQARARTHWAHETVAAYVAATLPSDAHTKCAGRLVLSMTRNNRREVVRAYETRDELIRALADSCRLPLISAPASCIFGRHDGYLAPTPPRSSAVVVTLPYPPVWQTVTLSLPIVWWACPFVRATDLRARARVAIAAGVDLAVPRIARTLDVPPSIVARTRAVLAEEPTRRGESEGAIAHKIFAVRRFVRRLVRRLLRQFLRGASTLTKLELLPRRA
jgi:hypothetical protein